VRQDDGKAFERNAAARAEAHVFGGLRLAALRAEHSGFETSLKGSRAEARATKD
jgi:hypothetical protein